MSNPVTALLARVSAALPTEAELIEQLDEGLAWWDEFIGMENSNDDV